MPKRVLVVDDDPAQRRILEETIKRFGYSVATADSGDKALAALKADTTGEICLVLLDLVMPGTDGLAVLSAMRSLPRKPPAIVQTAHGSIDAAITAMRAGAVDFVVKPVSPERLEVSIKNALKIEALADELVRIKASAHGELGFADLIAGSDAMKRVFELGKRAANSTIPVLIEGESGRRQGADRPRHPGRKRRAKPDPSSPSIAAPSPRIWSRAFCSATRRAPSPAPRRSAPASSSKPTRARSSSTRSASCRSTPRSSCLRALQDGEIDPVGGKHKVKVDFRLISATNQNLISLVGEGRFREDLYYRLNVFPIWVPPLRERLEDVPELVRHFIARFAAEEGKLIDGIDADAIGMLGRYSWPGNIRQLENAVFRAVVLADTPMLTRERIPADRRPCRGLRRDRAARAGAEGSDAAHRGPGHAGRIRGHAGHHSRAPGERQGRHRHPRA